MIDATVTGYAGDRLIASVERRRACARCLDGAGCGMGLLGRRSENTVTLRLPAPRQRPAVGSSIGLETRPGVLGAALVGYGLPLVGVLAGALAGPLAAGAGLMAGIAVARLLARGRIRWRVIERGPAR